MRLVTITLHARCNYSLCTSSSPLSQRNVSRAMRLLVEHYECRPSLVEAGGEPPHLSRPLIALPTHWLVYKLYIHQQDCQPFWSCWGQSLLCYKSRHSAYCTLACTTVSSSCIIERSITWGGQGSAHFPNSWLQEEVLRVRWAGQACGLHWQQGELNRHSSRQLPALLHKTTPIHCRNDHYKSHSGLW